MKLIARTQRWLRSLREDVALVRQECAALRDEVADAKMLAAKALIRQAAEAQNPLDLGDTEFRIFSQFGEDGIIQYLVRRAKIPRHSRSFVEFGVQSYVEANTRFLLINDNWRGLIMDADEQNIAAARAWPLFWKYDLTAKRALVDRDNVNDLIAGAGFAGEIGLLSIDVDGNDYWIWERIATIEPIIVVIEYNSLFGSSRAVTIPYDPLFRWDRAHYSHLYWGCSLRALELLGRQKGYVLVGSNEAGNNAFFVKETHLNGQPIKTAAQAYRECRFRASRDRSGNLNYLPARLCIDVMADMTLVDVENNAMVRVGDLSDEPLVEN